MGGILLAELAILGEYQLFFHFLLVALGIVSDPATQRTLEFYHCIFNLSHSLSLLGCLYSFSTLLENVLYVNPE